MILFAGIPTEAPLALALAAAERARVEHRVLDLREAALFDLQIEWGADGIDGTIALGDASLPLRAVTGIFARLHASARPPERRLTVRDAPGHEARAHARSVCALFEVLLDVWPTTVVNRPHAVAARVSKPVQAQAVCAAGLRTPTTIVTNVPDVAREFHAEHGRIVHKSASALRSIVAEWTPADGLPMSAVARLPTLFQALVAGDDVRVHVVGARTFATEVVSKPIGVPREGRRGGQATMLRPTDLPDDVAAACVALTRALGLEFAAVDLKRERDGVWHGLDVDPMPDYAAFETSAGQPIAAALVEHLSRPA